MNARTDWSSAGRSWVKEHRAKLFAVAGVILVALVVISCSTVERTVVVPPTIPGAEFVGSASCAECHEKINRDFHSATHARLKAAGPNANEVGCESCHGAGSIHAKSGGANHTILNPGKSPETCFQCHLDKRGEFNLPHHHPVLEGKMSCSDCHNPHRGDATRGGPFTHMSESDTCARCHTAQRGPFVFEHEAVRESCMTCHAVHGSVNQKMLVQRNHTLCLKCHFQQQKAGGLFIGGKDHTSFVSRGTCWSAGCHEAVHGSQIGSSLRF